MFSAYGQRGGGVVGNNSLSLSARMYVWQNDFSLHARMSSGVELHMEGELLFAAHFIRGRINGETRQQTFRLSACET